MGIDKAETARNAPWKFYAAQRGGAVGQPRYWHCEQVLDTQRCPTNGTFTTGFH
ncbi:MAG: hypothetical protein ACREP4_08010 [Stenotrophomonas sp.]|uniref:hypothetical protein n=1 Tax=Stenotrophomonas sp. TaxID=69392 RepID=UPI003D6CB715